MISREGQSVVIIGGGVIGMSCAYYLRKLGFTVTIIDQGTMGKACSHGNCGLISPSHLMPLAYPGAVSTTLKMMLKKNSPFRVKPHWNPRLWHWLMKFAFNCNQTNMVAGSRVLHQLLESSRTAYDKFLTDENIQCEFSPVGCLMVYRDPAVFEAYSKTNQFMGDEYGMFAEKWDTKTLHEREPALKVEAIGGWYYPQDGHLRPDKLMAGMKSTLIKTGVRLVENCKFVGIEQGQGQATAIRTSQGEIEADQFVFALGAWSPLFEKELGVHIPVQPGKGYSMTMPRPAICPKYSMLLPEVKLAVTPFETGYRLGSTMEFAGYDTQLNQQRLNALKEGASMYLRNPYTEPVEEMWYGWRPMTYDSLPIIDYSPKLKNVVIATGHSMLGVTLGPVTGMLVSEMLSLQQPHINLKPLSCQRF
jgi:D-amino-acid dehydrogenase